MTLTETLTITLNNYFPKTKHKRVKILDAMAGFWSYYEILSGFFTQRYKVEKIVGVEKEFLHKDYYLIFPHPLEYRVSPVEELPTEFNNCFDIITNFRPRCTDTEWCQTLLPAYKRMHQLVKSDGILFATTYFDFEAENLKQLLEDSDFNIKTVEKNKFDASQIHHGWIITAKP